MAELLTHFEKLTPTPLDGHAESRLGRKSSTSGVIKWVYSTGIQLISRMQLQEVLEQNGIRDSGSSALADALRVNQSLKTLK